MFLEIKQDILSELVAGDEVLIVNTEVKQELHMSEEVKLKEGL